jgi:hypothetical protein
VLELGLVLALLALLGVAGFLLPLFSWLALIQLGAAAIAFGLALGVPTGLVYHVKLARLLAARAELPPRWWLAPTRLHMRLRSAEQRAVLAWFYLGGAGFVITLAGCALVVAGALLWRY